MIENDDKKLLEFAELLEAHQKERYENQFGTEHPSLRDDSCKVSIKPKKKYIYIDVGHSGKYLVVRETGNIIGIKAYGVPHWGKRYGNLDTIHDYNWGDYSAWRRKKLALVPSERKKPCDHKGQMRWTGEMPLTGEYRCIMCGYVARA